MTDSSWHRDVLSGGFGQGEPRAWRSEPQWDRITPDGGRPGVVNRGQDPGGHDPEPEETVAAPPPPAPGGRARWRDTMAGRTALLTTAVAAVAVLIAGAVSSGLVRDATESEARRNLAQQADVVAQGIQDRDRTPPGVRRALDRQSILVTRVTPGGTLRTRDELAARLSEPHVQAVLDGREVSEVSTANGETYLVEGRPLPYGGGIILVQRGSYSGAFGRQLVGRTVLALVVGLAVAALAGWWLARRFSRPLRRTAVAAHALAGGERQIRVPEEGPAEVAEVAASLNALAAALEGSEGRQREFLLSVSHELRTPLTAVKGFAESLADGVTSGEDVRNVGATVLAEADRLDRLVSDLLDLARLGAQDFRLDLAEVDLVNVFTAAADVWRARCEALGVRFSVQLPAAPVLAHTDPTRVRQILDGLAENALRVTPAGRPVVFRLGAAPGWAVLEVRDGGPGLTPEDCEVAFDRSVLYERYRGVRRVGTGVGLALVHGLTTRLGGHARAGRAPEGGACFTVWLPEVSTPSGAPPLDGWSQPNLLPSPNVTVPLPRRTPGDTSPWQRPAGSPAPPATGEQSTNELPSRPGER